MPLSVNYKTLDFRVQRDLWGHLFQFLLCTGGASNTHDEGLAFLRPPGESSDMTWMEPGFESLSVPHQGRVMWRVGRGGAPGVKDSGLD